MAYEQGERDFVVRSNLLSYGKIINLAARLKLLQHKFEIENKDGTRETRTSTLSEYGSPFGSSGPSAMSRLVGTPCAVGKCIRQTVFFQILT